jgi:kynurenine formamidase
VSTDPVDFDDLFERLSNAGRWGAEDELGTLNFITPSKRTGAARLVTTGEVVSLARDLSTVPSPTNPQPVVHRMLYTSQTPRGAVDQMEIAAHGWAVTHLDAVGHMFYRGQLYNGRNAVDTIRSTGMDYGSIFAMRDGVVTRGVLLDIPAALGLPYLDETAEIDVDDLVAAERMAGTQVTSGDALIVRAGNVPRQQAARDATLDRLPGLGIDALGWLRDREVALFGGDCDDRVPSGFDTVPFPIHQLGLAAMGLCLLDNVEVEALGRHCASMERYEFMFVVAPLRLPAATGSAVNPLAIF